MSVSSPSGARSAVDRCRMLAGVSAREADRPGHRISLRLSDELYAQVRKLAERDRRAVATWIKILIEDVVSAAREGTSATRKR